MSGLERQIESAAAQAVRTAIESELVGYNKPLSRLVNEALERYAPTLRALVDGALDDMLGSEEFADALRDALNRKLAKVLVSKLGGALEARANEMMSHPETRAKVITVMGAALDRLGQER